jgi:VanZ family protein
VTRGETRRLIPFAVVVVVSLVVLFAPEAATPTGAPGADKLVHVALFATLAMTGTLGGLARPGLATALVAYAAASEVLQGVLPIGRSADPLDALVDVLGVVLGLLVAVGVRSPRG